MSPDSARAVAEKAPLTFGTAGLRGPVGPGLDQMNAPLIARVSWALAEFLKEQGLHARPLLIGFDARAESAPWARLAAEIHRAAGQEVWLLPRPGPTPWVAFGVRHFQAAAGVVLTPSHNPRGDAGYKLFDSDGVQIVAPWDTRIAQLMSQAPPFECIARSPVPDGSCPIDLWPAYDAWLDELGAKARGSAERQHFELAYTPLHGVGFEAAARAATRQGATLDVVAEQREPDTNFPTTPFPNPEEPGALDLLLALCRAHGHELGAAHDPDADRFALVVARSPQGLPLPLSGDQLGLLLADVWLEATALDNPLVVSTLVSSPGLDVLAEQRGARLERTLTGFKWLGRPALDDPGFVFSYEEALGYCFGLGDFKAVLDKDGIAALTVVVALVQRGLAEGQNSPGRVVLERLRSLAARIGLWVSVGHGLRLNGGVPAAVELVGRLRRAPPSAVGGRRLLSIDDFSLDAEQRPAYLGAQDLLVLMLDGGARICVRPSGTEPKLKLYVHLSRPFATTDDYASIESAATHEARELGVALADWLTA